MVSTSGVEPDVVRGTSARDEEHGSEGPPGPSCGLALCLTALSAARRFGRDPSEHALVFLRRVGRVADRCCLGDTFIRWLVLAACIRRPAHFKHDGQRNPVAFVFRRYGERSRACSMRCATKDIGGGRFNQ
jgi:hypothetical protein